MIRCFSSCVRGLCSLLLLVLASTLTKPASAEDVVTSAGETATAPFEIDATNIASLEPVWTHRVGAALPSASDVHGSPPVSKPLLVGERLILCSGRGRVEALDPERGKSLWLFDAGGPPASLFPDSGCPGVAVHRAPAELDAEATLCATRVFVATADARLIALDESTGSPCHDFGDGGEVDLASTRPEATRGVLAEVTAPVVVADLVAVGTSGVEAGGEASSGLVQAFDALTGEEAWRWDPVPQASSDPARLTWAGHDAPRAGRLGVGGTMVADSDRELLFVPTSSPSPSGFGGARLGDNRHGSSVVALNASTGQLVWRFQTVHHDLWGYDVTEPPLLVEFEHAGRIVAALVQATKMGHLFVLDRETGEPVFPVEERGVPGSDLPGELVSPTQPFPSWPLPLAPPRLAPEDAWGVTPIDAWLCRREIEGLRSEGLFTPPSVAGSVVFPGAGGRAGPGGIAWDSERQLLVETTSRVAETLRLIPNEEVATDFEVDGRIVLAREDLVDTPHVAKREALLSPLGLPCSPPPWGSIRVLDFASRQMRWRATLGSARLANLLPIDFDWGSPLAGPPLVTAGGIVFVGGTTDERLRAFDVATGQLLFETALDMRADSTPLYYRGPRSDRPFVLFAVRAIEGEAPEGSGGEAWVAFSVSGSLPQPQPQPQP